LLSPQTPLEGSWRFEYKYRLPYDQYYQVRNSLWPYMRMDGYSLKAPEKKYLVRSLYFDTDDLFSYHEKVEGDCDRIKLRIRTYTSDAGDKPNVRVELKARKNMSMEKYGSWVKFEEYQEFLRTRRWPLNHDPVLVEFERHVHFHYLNPKIIVEYHREGFEARNTDDIRVTFDHYVQSAWSKDLFPDAPNFRSHHKNLVVLEIKCNKRQPEWLRSVVIDHGLRIMSNSKFVQGITIALREIVTPSWSM